MICSLVFELKLFQFLILPNQVYLMYIVCEMLTLLFFDSKSTTLLFCNVAYLLTGAFSWTFYGVAS